MIVAFFLPSMVATVPYAGTMSLSLSALMSLAGANSYTSSISFLLLIYLFPALCCIIDLVITKENSSRHVRLIILGFLNMLLQSSFSTLAELSSSIRELSSLIGSSADVGLGIGFYLSVLASIVIVVVGAIGIYEKKKGKISA